MTKGFEMKKVYAREVACEALHSVDSGEEELLVGEFTKELKRTLSAQRPMYPDPPEIS